MEKKEALEILGMTGNETREEINAICKKMDEEYNFVQNSNDPKIKRLSKALSMIWRTSVDERAYDEYVFLFNSLKAEAKKLKRSLPKEYYNYTNISNRGKVSEKIYQSLKASLQSDFNAIKKDIIAYDSFVNYLKCDMSNPLNLAMLEKLKGKRGILSFGEISRERIAFVKEVNKKENETLIKENVFYTFQKFYKEMQEDLRVHYGKKLIYQGELDLESDLYSPEIYQGLKEEMNECKEYFETEKKEKFSIFTDELLKRNIDKNFYLSLRKVNGKIPTYDTLTLPDLDKLLETFDLMDKIENILLPLNIPLEKYLKDCGKTIETVKKEELEIILKDVQKLHDKISIIDGQDMMRR